MTVKVNVFTNVRRYASDIFVEQLLRKNMQVSNGMLIIFFFTGIMKHLRSLSITKPNSNIVQPTPNEKFIEIDLGQHKNNFDDISATKNMSKDNYDVKKDVRPKPPPPPDKFYFIFMFFIYFGLSSIMNIAYVFSANDVSITSGK